MKVCITHIKTFKKPDCKKETDKFIDKLIKCGMPEDKTDELMKKGRVFWEKEDMDSNVIYAAEIIK